MPIIANDDREKQDFCDIGIFTIYCDCALHIDNVIIANLDASFTLKLGLLSVLTYLNEYQRESENLDLEHITEWGVGSLTTCAYQCVGDAAMEDVETIQYFCCRGFGIFYRICSYWVHLFLAYFFLHYTLAEIFINNGKVYLGKYPGKSMSDWV